MTSLHLGHARPQPSRTRKGAGALVPAMAALLLPIIVGAIGSVGYALWPRWSEPLVARDAPALPITIAGVIFNVPPAAVRMPVQRHAGAQDRIDLAFLWPSLDPPDLSNTAATAMPAPPTASRAFERIFVTISVAGEALAPTERLKTIYPRYLETAPTDGPGGLSRLGFRAGTPYQREDLIYDADASDGFLVRCTRNGAGSTPGVCLYERRIDKADLVVRFPRDWLNEWRMVADRIDQLLHNLRLLAD
jgi:hypothetical protein